MPQVMTLAMRQQIGAAMVIDDALGIAGGARGVVERDGVPFVVRHQPGEIGIALAQKILVFDAAEPLAGAGEFRIVIVDDQRLAPCAAPARLSPPWKIRGR